MALKEANEPTGTLIRDLLEPQRDELVMAFEDVLSPNQAKRLFDGIESMIDAAEKNQTIVVNPPAGSERLLVAPLDELERIVTKWIGQLYDLAGSVKAASTRLAKAQGRAPKPKTRQPAAKGSTPKRAKSTTRKAAKKTARHK